MRQTTSRWVVINGLKLGEKKKQILRSTMSCFIDVSTQDWVKQLLLTKKGFPKWPWILWYKKFECKPEAQDSLPGFSRIKLADTTSQDLVSRIIFPNGISLDLFGSFDQYENKVLLLWCSPYRVQSGILCKKSHRYAL